MLFPDQINALRKKAEKITEPVIKYLLQDISMRIAEAGQLSSTAAYEIWTAQKLGVSQREMKKELRRLLKLSHREIRRLFYESAQSGYSLDVSRFPQVQAVPFQQNAVLQQIVSAAAELADQNFTNLTQTLGMVDPHGNALPLQKAYRACTDFAFQQVMTGAASYTEAVRQATKNLAAQGVRVIDYQSGVYTSLEAAVRRNMLGGLGLMQDQISQVTHDQLGCDGWEITAHAMSAPDHEPFQGRQYSDAAYQELNGSLVRRIGTLNCGHAAFPIILGVNSPQYTPEELEKFRTDNEMGVTIDGKHYTGYEATQMQRKLERAIRRQKNRILVDEATGDAEKLAKDKLRLTLLNQRYRAFCKAAGLRTQWERAEVAGFGERLQAFGQSAGGISGIWENGEPVQIGRLVFSDKATILDKLSEVQKMAVKLPYEINCTVTSDGKVWLVKGSEGIVHPETIPSSLEGSYSYHNHPSAVTKYSFSAEDVRFFFQSGEEYSKASDYVYEYVMQRTLETPLAVDPEMVYYRFKEIYQSDIYRMSSDKEIDIDVDGFHETMCRLSQEYHFFYERVKIDGN